MTFLPPGSEEAQRSQDDIEKADRRIHVTEQIEGVDLVFGMMKTFLSIGKELREMVLGHQREVTGNKYGI